MKPATQYTEEQVAKHDKKDDLFIIIENNVYDASKFVTDHPGGEDVLLGVAGQDASDEFLNVGHSEDAKDMLKNFLVGKVQGKKSSPKVQNGLASKTSKSKDVKSASSMYNVYLILFVVAAVFGVYIYR